MLKRGTCSYNVHFCSIYSYTNIPGVPCNTLCSRSLRHRTAEIALASKTGSALRTLVKHKAQSKWQRHKASDWSHAGSARATQVLPMLLSCKQGRQPLALIVPIHSIPAAVGLCHAARGRAAPGQQLGARPHIHPCGPDPGLGPAGRPARRSPPLAPRLLLLISRRAAWPPSRAAAAPCRRPGDRVRAWAPGGGAPRRRRRPGRRRSKCRAWDLRQAQQHGRYVHGCRACRPRRRRGCRLGCRAHALRRRVSVQLARACQRHLPAHAALSEAQAFHRACQARTESRGRSCNCQRVWRSASNI